MGKMSCFAGLLGGGRRKALKGKNKGAYAKKVNGNDCPKVKPVEFMDMPDATVDVSGCEDSAPASCNSKVVVRAATELARDGSGEDGDKAAIKRACSSGADLAVAGAGAGESVYSSDGTEESAKSTEPGAGEECPAAGRTSPAPTPAASPKLKRSCSNIETTRSSAPPRGFDFDLDLPAKSRSYNDLNAAPPARSAATPSGAGDASPAAASFRSSCSADRVMLKKRSSRQVLPSRSRKLWWRLFLWSHSNLHHAGGHARHAAATVGRAPPARRVHVRHAGRGHRGQREGKGAAVEEGPIPNQWVAFSAGASPLDRVSAWVNSLGDGSFYHAVDEEEDDVSGHDGAAAAAVRPQCSDDEIVEVPAAGKRRPARAKRRTAADEAVNEARSVVHTLNAFSSAAHIAGMGLKAVPAIAGFSTLRAVNLSGNLIVQISAGSLPKGLRSLDLSRNRIAAVEGLREMTRLRVLNLSYNRISRIGHGLSSCTAIKELYLAGNKISDVEGLHRLLKLAVLDLSFNKITTAKSMGQLVANYGSLRALNLVGNPVQVATGDDALRRAVSGLLPRIEYLNKQAVRPQRAREAAKDSVAQAALGIGGAGDGWSSRRRAARRVTKSPGGSSGKGRGRDGSGSRRGGGGGSRSRSKTRAQAAGAGPSVSRR